MGLLAPLFLLGLALIALPIWLHRLKTETPERQAFASSMFLQASEDPIHVKRQLRYLLLMCLRVLFLLLLALAFSRPFWPSNDTVQVSQWNNVHLIIVDTSASMMGADKQDKARQAVVSIINSVESGEAIQLFSIDQTLQKQSEIELDSSRVVAAFNQIEPVELALDYDAVARAVEALMSADQTVNNNYQIHFVSDFQQSSMPSRFADLIPEPTSAVSYQLFTHNIVDDNQDLINLTIDQVEIVGQAARISVRSYAYDANQTADSVGQATTFELRAKVNQQAWQSATGEVDLSGRVTISIDGFEFLPQQNELRVELLVDDALIADNTFYRVVNRSAPEPLLLLTDNPYGPSALYVSALFSNQTKGGSAPNYVAQSAEISSFDTRTLNRFSWVLVDDIGSVDTALANRLSSYVQEGGSVFFASAAKAESLQNLPIVSLPVLQQTDLAGLGTNKVEFRSISLIDDSHQSLNQLTGWSQLRFEKWLSVTDTQNSDVLLQLEGGVPLLLEQKIGRGKVMILTSSIDNLWNNLPVKPIFVALLRNVAQYLSGAELIQAAAYAGETLNIQGNNIGAGQLIDPQGNAVLALGDSLQSGQLSMDKLGFYQASTAAGNSVIAVNLPPSESGLATVSSESLTQWQTIAQRNLQTTSPISDQVFSGAEQTYTNLWFWLLLLAGIVVALESLLANMKLASNTRILRPAKN